MRVIKHLMAVRSGELPAGLCSQEMTFPTFKIAFRNQIGLVRISDETSGHKVGCGVDAKPAAGWSDSEVLGVV